MKALRLLVTIGAFLLATHEGRPQGAADVLHWLAGRWTGPGMTLSIDPERLQANLDPAKPFQWEPFRLRDVTGCMVTFDVGPRRFVGLMFAGRVMHINSVNLVGEQSLRADPDKSLPRLRCPEEPKAQPPAGPNAPVPSPAQPPGG